MTDLSNNDLNLLRYAIENNIISIDGVRSEMEYKERQTILAQHKYSIYQSKDERWSTYLPDSTKKNGRRQITKTYKEDLEEYIVRYYRPQDEPSKQNDITLEEIFPEWLEYKSLRTRASSYVIRLEYEWKKFYQGTEISRKPISEFTKLGLDNWAHGIIKENDFTKKQYYNMAIIMKQTLEYATDKEIIHESPFAKVKVDSRLFRRIKKPASELQVFTRSEIEQIHKLATSDIENRLKVHKLSPLAILMMFQAPIRIGEICTFRYEDIENEDYLHIQRMLRHHNNEIVEHTKSEAGDRKIILTDAAKEIIAKAKEIQNELSVESDGYIFSLDGEPCNYNSIHKLYYVYCDKIGTIRKSSHKARKTVISALIDGNVNINTIREMAGHTDERTTYNNYAFDRNTEVERKMMIKHALA